ncbi:hypothetical protein AMS68_000826 [Peltaster fructicola]|uniref:Uncharacterized protein n=1 Tax=Peltaster fructicola TaxID=286661 RepID=A0A6H0XL08_9PEZI|nr:hypothetical protein AMS68_000826 [Peltaster fructicola]
MAAFASQFALSLELTHLVPQIASVSGSVLRSVARQIRASGSDILVEDDLVAIFGRNRLDPLFESSFKTAVREKSVTPLAGLIDIVLEGGAGPTVDRSLSHPALLSSLAQLSLLAFAHDPEPLTQLLRRSLEGRAVGSNELPLLPQFDQLKGTLQAIGEQTTAYRWELVLAAIETRLVGGSVIQSDDILSTRSLPQAILQGLLDDLTAVQYFREHKVISIRTRCGIPTIVAWAHKLLGLTVSVICPYTDKNIKFGEGLDQVVITSLHYSCVPFMQEGCSITLLGDDGSDFSIRNAEEVTPTQITNCPHMLSGYGTAGLRYSGAIDAALQTSLAHWVLALCLREGGQRLEALKHASQLPTSGSVAASSVKIVEAATVLFHGFDLSVKLAESLLVGGPLSDKQVKRRLANAVLSAIGVPFDQSEEDSADEPCSFVSEPLGDNEELCLRLQATVFTLRDLTLALSFIHDIKDCHLLPLTLRAIVDRSSDEERAPASAADSWKILTAFLYGSEWCKDYHCDRSCVMSNNGWSLVLGTVLGSSPGNMLSSDHAFKGVPTRNQERARLVIDSFDQQISGRGMPIMRAQLSSNEASKKVDFKGQRFTTDNKVAARFTGTLSAMERLHMEIVQQIELDYGTTQPSYLRVGLRHMQSLYWGAIRLPSCRHINGSTITMPLPPHTRVVDGWKLGEIPRFMPSTVCLSSTAGNGVAQWVMLCCAAHIEGGTRETCPVTYVRSSNCCLDCAVQAVIRDRPGLVKLLIT